RSPPRWRRSACRCPSTRTSRPATSTASSPRSATSMAAERVHRIGLVGAGSMGQLHARVIANDPATELVWVADPDRVAGTAVADRFGSRWIAEPDLAAVDAVVVAAPTHLHHAIAVEVI